MSTLELPLVCTASGAYDETGGNPAGSFAAKTEIPVNLIGLFKSEITAESPNFTVGEGGGGAVRVERQFVPGGLVSVTPSFAYTVTLVDKTDGTKQNAIAETMTAASAFVAREGGVSLTAGHTYSVQIVAVTKSTAASVGLLGGEALGRFDNVVVSGPNGIVGPNPPGGEGGNGGEGSAGGNGANGITSSQLKTLVESQGLSGPATIAGNTISVKAKCPTAVGVTCNVALQGQIRKGKAATNSRRAKIKQGKTKKFGLKVKPAMKTKVRAKKRLLFKMTVKAGTAKATVYKSLKLIRR